MARNKKLLPDSRVLSDVQRQEFEAFIAENLDDLSLPAGESEGFLFIPGENIKVIPAALGGEGGLMEIHEPAGRRGHERFDRRDRYEKNYPEKLMEKVAVFENQVYEGQLTPSPFHLEVGARVCVATVKEYQTKDDTYLSLTILPMSGQRYSGAAKISARNMVRGIRFPYAKDILKNALRLEGHTLEELQKQHPKEKWLSQADFITTGVWTVRFYNQSGKYSDIRGCHIFRDAQTGSLDIFIIQKQYIFDNFNHFHLRESFFPWVKHAIALVALDDLKKTPEGQPLPLLKLYFKNKELAGQSQLPETFQEIISFRNSHWQINELKFTPPLRAFINYEKKVVSQTSRKLGDDIRQKIGELFEKLVGKCLGIDKNMQFLSVDLPEPQILEEMIKDFPAIFKKWAISFSKDGHVVVRPDFILQDGTFVEVKSGGNIETKTDKVDQLFRMVLYKIVKQQPLKIRYLMLEGSTAKDPIFDFIRYENILETELAEKIPPDDLDDIKSWLRQIK